MNFKAWRETVDDKLASLAENGCNCQHDEDFDRKFKFTSSTSQPEELFNSTIPEELCHATSQEIHILPTNPTQPSSFPKAPNFINPTMATGQTSCFKPIKLPKFDKDRNKFIRGYI